MKGPLRSIVICPDLGLADRLVDALALHGGVEVVRTVGGYPSGTELLRIMRAVAPDLIFLSFDSVDRANGVVDFLNREITGLQIIAIHKDLDANVLRETMRAGLREFIAYPFEATALRESIKHCEEILKEQPPDHHATSNIFSFLPSKAGVGTSTIALNVSSALATKGGEKVMLADFDLSSGMQRFLLKLSNTYSVMDAIEHSLDMDEALWPQLVTTMGNMDVLHSGRINPSLRIEGAQVRSLIQFMRRNYQALCFDLSGNLERYSMELMQESRRIFVVVTPEIPSLHVAREKIAFLRELDLGDRIAIILNRGGKKPVFGEQQVQDILGAPVVANLANDYLGVNNATSAGGPVEPTSELGKQLTKFALSLIDKKPEEKPQAKKSFLNFLTPSAAASR